MPTFVLSLGGNQSAANFLSALDALEEVLPRVGHVQLSGVGHLAADDAGKPEHVAHELRRFFSGGAH